MPYSTELDNFFEPKERVWNGKKVNSLFDKDASIGQVAELVLGINPQKVIQICDTTGERLTCKDLLQFSNRIAHNLRLKLGLQQEDVIGIMGYNSTYLAPLVLGAFFIGAPINAIHSTFDKNTVKHIFGLTKPKVIFCDEIAHNTLVLALNEMSLSCQIYTLKGQVEGVPNVKDLLQVVEGEDSLFPTVLQNGGNQTAVILCSSGSTGLPKGVCLSHRNLLGRLVCDFPYIGSEDILFSYSTLYCFFGLWNLVQSIIKGALRIITDELFSPEHLFGIINKYKITQLLGPPFHVCLAVKCSDITNYDFSSIKTYICGGSALSPSISNKIKEYMGNNSLSESYGLTECGGIITVNKWPHQKEGSVGRLNPNTRAKIIGDHGEALGVREIGEIYMWSPFKWNGYYGNPEMTKHTVDANGWIRTGDLGYFDEDGYLFVAGRQKDILKYRNFQISPIEIEEPIQKIPGVIEVCVFGMPDEEACDLPAAAIVKSPGCNLTKEDVCRTVVNCLSEVKHLRGGVFFVDELPKTPSGKIQRQKVLPLVKEMRKLY